MLRARALKKEVLDLQACAAAVQNRLKKGRWQSITATIGSLPVVIRSPLGVLSTGDVLFLLSIVFLCAYTFGRECYLSFIELNHNYKENPADYKASMYDVLLLVGGGIGVTPLLALLRDILHRKRRGDKHLPSKVHLYHCVRKPEELCVLNSIDPNEILPNYQEHAGLDIRVFVYVTSSSPTDYPSSIGSADSYKGEVLDLATFEGLSVHQAGALVACREVVFSRSGPKAQSISSISTSGQALWVSSVTLASLVGFYVLWGLSNVLIVRQYDADFTNYNRTHVLTACMILGTVLFGGIPTSIWWLKLKMHHKSKSAPAKVGIMNGSPDNGHLYIPDHTSTKDEENMGLITHGSPWHGTLQLFCRPAWKDVFVGMNKEYQGHDIGVLVSGGLAMQEDIAEQCRSYMLSNIFGNGPSNNFHYHPISFDI
ncbi:hypothetical protein L7F22_012796 [Adiantum nelumboides]|nr:hypothetical protein [Adiantum nelumboides]